MAKVLHLDSSSRSATSLTRVLSKHFADGWLKTHSKDTVVYHDLSKEGVPFLTDTDVASMYTPEAARSAEQREAYAQIAKRVDEFIDADVYVLGVPMYNFNVPAVFKAYIDRIVVVGKTFAYSDTGTLTPLLKNKKAFVLTASGGDYDTPPYNDFNFHEPYLRAIFGFIGIKDITFVKVSGHSEDVIKAGLESAKAQIEAIVKQNAKEIVTASH